MDAEPEPVEFDTLSPSQKLAAIFAALCDVMGRMDQMERLLIAEIEEDAEPNDLSRFEPEGPMN